MKNFLNSSLSVKIMAYVLTLQLAVGSFPLRMPAASAAPKKVSTHRVERTDDEQSINTPIEAERYVKETEQQIKFFDKMGCIDDHGKVKTSAAFVLADHVSENDMDVKNCEIEAQKLKHHIALSNELIAEYGFNSQQGNCAECSLAAQKSKAVEADTKDGANSCPPKKKAEIAKQSCNFFCQMKPALSIATAGLTSVLGGLVGDGCPKETVGKTLGTGLKCAANIAKGMVLAIWDAIKGLANLVWEGAKWVGKKIKSAGKRFLVWAGFMKAESKTADNIHAVSQQTQQQVADYQKNKGSWFTRTAKNVVNFLWDTVKEILYIGKYQRDSQCMTCSEKGQLLCEIGGRIVSDVVGFTFTLGVGYGAVKTAAAKLLPEVTEALAKLSVTAEEGSIAAKAAKATKTGLRVAGDAVVATGKAISRTATRSWKLLQESKAYRAILKSEVSETTIKALKAGGKRASESIPGKIVIKVGRGVRNGFDRYAEFDNEIFGKGAGVGGKATDGILNTTAAKIHELRRQGKYEEASRIAMAGVDELNVGKEAKDALGGTEKAKRMVARMKGVTKKQLNGIEDLTDAAFEKTGKDALEISTDVGAKEVKVKKADDVISTLVSPDAKTALIRNKDGSVHIIDLEKDRIVHTIPPKEAKVVDELTGVRSMDGKSAEEAARIQTETNLDLNGVKYEEKTEDGKKVVEIKTPKGCDPKSVTLGVDRAR